MPPPDHKSHCLDKRRICMNSILHTDPHSSHYKELYIWVCMVTASVLILTLRKISTHHSGASPHDTVDHCIDSERCMNELPFQNAL